jgi:hypothetical protein
MASEAVVAAAPSLDYDLVFVECGIIRRLKMLLFGCSCSSAEKKARWRGHWIVCAGWLWKPCAGCRTGEVELPDKNSGTSCMSGSSRMGWKLQRRTARKVWQLALRYHAQDRYYGSSPWPMKVPCPRHTPPSSRHLRQQEDAATRTN